MSISQLSTDLHSSLLELSGEKAIHSVQLVQELWSGYGQILRVVFDSASSDAPLSVVVKQIQAPSEAQHPRGWNTAESDQRKVRSYEVEQAWYEQHSKYCPGGCKVPKLLASNASDSSRWLILEDLNTNYPKRHQYLNLETSFVCLAWLARFHANFLDSEGEGLWPIGTYWHLETRQQEFQVQENSALKKMASVIDETLNGCRFKTLVHGDAKVANFCFSKSGDAVAAVDFQYVGKGCGVKDVVYFLGSCLDDQACIDQEANLLDFYFSQLKLHLPADKADDVEAEWRNLYDLAAADFHRFLAGWMPEHPKVNRYMALTTDRALSQLKSRKFTP